MTGGVEAYGRCIWAAFEVGKLDRVRMGVTACGSLVIMGAMRWKTARSMINEGSYGACIFRRLIMIEHVVVH